LEDTIAHPLEQLLKNLSSSSDSMSKLATSNGEVGWRFPRNLVLRLSTQRHLD